jgi:hypothetical protein
MARDRLSLAVRSPIIGSSPLAENESDRLHHFKAEFFNTIGPQAVVASEQSR